MPWPKGYSKEQVRAMSPEERKELFAKPKEVVSDSKQLDSDKTPPVPRLPRLSAEVRASKPAKKTWTMKAGNNWDTAVITEETPDELRIPLEDWPEGMALMWATRSIYGQETKQLLANVQRVGWTPVHADDFDGKYAKRWAQDDGGFIVKEACILVARPMEMEIAARKRDKQRAEEQIAMKEQAFKGGEIRATGANDPAALAHNRISRSIERVEIPKD